MLAAPSPAITPARASVMAAAKGAGRASSRRSITCRVGTFRFPVRSTKCRLASMFRFVAFRDVSWRFALCRRFVSGQRKKTEKLKAVALDERTHPKTRTPPFLYINHGTSGATTITTKENTRQQRHEWEGGRDFYFSSPPCPALAGTGSLPTAHRRQYRRRCRRTYPPCLRRPP